MGTTHWALWALLGLGTIGFWAIVAIAAGSLFGRVDPRAPLVRGPRAELDEQLARGQISIDEHEDRRRHLADGH
jgi:putative membrane protein